VLELGTGNESRAFQSPVHLRFWNMGKSQDTCHMFHVNGDNFAKTENHMAFLVSSERPDFPVFYKVEIVRKGGDLREI
jgi:hypothetical protein